MVLHAVVPRDASPVAGLDLFPGTAVGVLYETRDQRPAPTTGEVLAFGHRIHLAAGAGPVLPVRFGTVAADADELGRLVRDSGPRWADRLQRVAGHRELIVHRPGTPESSATCGVSPLAAAGTAAAGADYLRARVSSARAAAAAWEELLAPVRDRVAEQRVLPGPPGPRLALLVRAHDVEPVRAALERPGSGAGGAAQVTGPWPPYSFSEEVLDVG
ncbi:GvpL/GvpF family gas vesicle protein [Nocardioides mesophilus]|nr:GvpL/GvpF family gas vesicle protein [Nocardioides mesophilus]